MEKKPNIFRTFFKKTGAFFANLWSNIRKGMRKCPGRSKWAFRQKDARGGAAGSHGII